MWMFHTCLKFHLVSVKWTEEKWSQILEPQCNYNLLKRDQIISYFIRFPDKSEVCLRFHFFEILEKVVFTSSWSSHLRNSCRRLRIVHVSPEIAQVEMFFLFHERKTFICMERKILIQKKKQSGRLEKVVSPCLVVLLWPSLRIGGRSRFYRSFSFSNIGEGEGIKADKNPPPLDNICLLPILNYAETAGTYLTGMHSSWLK